MPHHRRAELQEAAKSFCDAFASKAAPDEIFAHFSASAEVCIYEHGLQELAPFLGCEFKGQNGIREYFDTISSCLSYNDMIFSNYVVDAVENKVSVKGTAKFTWTSTGQSWNEVFAYSLAFDQDKKVLKYEIWADTGAAYLASKGLLRQ